MTMLLSILLLALALLHILWAIGFWWPVRDERQLVATVIGVTTATRMPGPIPSALVAVVLICAAAWPWFAPHWIRHAGIGAIALVFIVRGLIAYHSRWGKLTAQEPFRTYDRRYYGPLCLVIGAGFTLLFLKGI